ncbi:MAG: hypothetical protein MJK04_15790 [Psychrosphaera sp.]|nr:hypothetical protein [Psychrosphaera sp.]
MTDTVLIQMSPLNPSLASAYRNVEPPETIMDNGFWTIISYFPSRNMTLRKRCCQFVQDGQRNLLKNRPYDYAA